MSASTEDSTVSVKQDESTSTDTETQEMEVPAVASDRIRDQIELSLNDALASGELAKAVEAMVVSAGCSIVAEVKAQDETQLHNAVPTHELPAQRTRTSSNMSTRLSHTRLRRRDRVKAFFGRAFNCVM